MGANKDLSYNLTGNDVSASKTMQSFAGNAEHATGRIGSAFGKVGGMLGGEFGEILNKVGEGVEKLGEHTRSMSGAMVLGGGIASGLGMALNAMGASDKQAADQLQQSVTNSGHSWELYKGEVETAIKTQEGFGHTAVDTQTALQKLTQATDDPKKALELMGVTADLAAARHMNLADASQIVAKVINGGGGKILKEYGVTMATTGDKTKNAELALDQLSKKVSGQASVSMDNFNGFLKITKVTLEDVGAKVGQVAGPVLTVLGPAMMVFGTVLDLVKTKQAANAAATTLAAEASAAKAIADDLAAKSAVGAALATDGATVALGVEAVATDVATVSTEALNTAWKMSPVGLVLGGMALLVGVLAAVALSSKGAEVATDDYTAALTTDNNLIGEATRRQAQKALVDAGAMDAAKKLGITTEELTQAALGNAPAMEHVAEVSKEAAKKFKDLADGTNGATGATKEQVQAALELSDAGRTMNATVEHTSASITDSSTRLGVESDAMGAVAGSSQALAQGLGLMVGEYNGLKTAQDGATQASKDWKTELDILNGAALTMDAAQVAMASTAQAFASTIAGNLKAATTDAERSAARSMDINTTAGLANHNNIVAQINANNDLGAAIVKSEGDTVEAHNHAREAQEAGIKKILEGAGAQEVETGKVQELIDTIGKIPPRINIIATLDTSSADKSLNDLNSRVNFRRDESGYTLAPATHATGGTVMGGGSGISDSVPIMASAGEEVIGATNAARWRPLLKEINAGRTPTLAGGGGGGGVTIGTFIAQQNHSAAEIATELGWIGRWAT